MKEGIKVSGVNVSPEAGKGQEPKKKRKDRNEGEVETDEEQM